MFAANTGATIELLVLPLPSCPLELSPQQPTTPPLMSTLQRCVAAKAVLPRGARPPRHPFEQPSPLTVFPSSHVSPMPACTSPSPQRGALQTPAMHRFLPPLTSEQSALAWHGAHWPWALQRELFGSPAQGWFPRPATHWQPLLGAPLQSASSPKT